MLSLAGGRVGWKTASLVEVSLAVDALGRPYLGDKEAHALEAMVGDVISHCMILNCSFNCFI